VGSATLASSGYELSKLSGSYQSLFQVHSARNLLTSWSAQSLMCRLAVKLDRASPLSRTMNNQFLTRLKPKVFDRGGYSALPGWHRCLNRCLNLSSRSLERKRRDGIGLNGYSLDQNSTYPRKLDCANGKW
jgi:hypothetical protein